MTMDIRIGSVKELGEEILSKRTEIAARDQTLEMSVREILETVRTGGDRALLELTRTYDKVDISKKGLRVSNSDIESACSKVDVEDLDALKYLQKSIGKIETWRLKALNSTYSDRRITLHQVARPLHSVGCYIPGGHAVYPSTVVMTTVPARLAGVPRTVMFSPPSVNGDIDPLVLAAAQLCGVKEVYRVGGAQAIAAMAYGTETIQPVDKILGPASRLVTTAKQMVRDKTLVDMPAGPSEILVLADDSSNDRSIALDLISQAEHAPDNVSVLVTTSQRIVDKVTVQLSRSLEVIPRKEIVKKSLETHGALLLAESLPQAIGFINRFAPEHLEILSRRPTEVSKEITSSGIILLGNNTPVAASDYGLGTNHVLPTMGFARTYSGLSVLDYVKIIPIVRSQKSTLRSMLRFVRTLAKREGLPNHYSALAGRFKND
jgi:histidinol dehydrogenase